MAARRWPPSRGPGRRSAPRSWPGTSHGRRARRARAGRRRQCGDHGARQCSAPRRFRPDVRVVGGAASPQRGRMASREGRMAASPGRRWAGFNATQVENRRVDGTTTSMEGKAITMTSKRNIAAILGGIAAVALFLIVNPWFAVDPKSTARSDRDGRLLGLVHRPARRPLRDAQGAGRRDHRDRGPGVHAVPVRQLAGRPVLAARSACSSASPGWRPASTSSAAPAGWTAAPRSQGYWTARGRRSRRRAQAARRSPTTGTARSSRPCSTTTPTPGSPRSSCSVRWRSGSASSSAS